MVGGLVNYYLLSASAQLWNAHNKTNYLPLARGAHIIATLNMTLAIAMHS